MYRGRLCVSYRELTGGEVPVLSVSSYKQYVRRGRIVVMRRGCCGSPALVDYEMLPEAVKRGVRERYGDPGELVRVEDELRRRIVKDLRAEAFFSGYSPSGQASSTLGWAHVCLYTAEASVLTAALDLAGDLLARGWSRGRAWVRVSELVNGLQGEYGCRLPESAAGLRRKAERYVREGYVSLVSGKFCNANSRKNRASEQRGLLVELLGNGRNLEDAQIARLYNMTAQRLGWPTVTDRTVGNYRREHPEAYPGRHGLRAYRDRKSMQVLRSRPSAPMLMWSSDGWCAELLYQERVDGRVVYHQRPVVVVVLDVYNNYPVGYAVGRRETPDLIRAAYREAFRHVRELFGGLYKPSEVQTDHYSMKLLRGMYEGSSVHYVPAEVGNAKSKAVEPWFGQWNRRYFRLLENTSGLGVKSGELRQPSADYVSRVKRRYPDFAGVCAQVRACVEAERRRLREGYVGAWASSGASSRVPFPEAEYLRLYGERTPHAYKLHGQGIVLTLDGARHVYDCFDAGFRDYGDRRFILAYDPDRMERVLAIVAGGRVGHPEETGVRFVLEEKYVQPMALADRKSGDGAELARVRQYNRAREESFIELRRASAEAVDRLWGTHGRELANDTALKLVVTDSLGRHKDWLQPSALPCGVGESPAGEDAPYEYDPSVSVGEL